MKETPIIFSTEKCQCGKDAEWDFGDEKYCQECWEAYCSTEYWRWWNSMADRIQTDQEK